ncbi:MAG: aspartate/glutamate racemase family protein [Caldilineaceae bacterium]|nr:aspartate/glutamate racemase family protein [Caldilineaceae bacterium]
MPTLALVHTGTFLTSVFTDLCREAMPDVDIFNIVDESLIKNTIAANELTPQTSRRLAEYLRSAQEAGADAILVTCSSIGPAVEAARPFLDIPVLRVDTPMADEAIRRGERIGVVATLPTTLKPTVELIERQARLQGKAVDVISSLCEGAFDAVASGDAETHDRLVAAAIRELMSQADVIVLAQASMARAADTIPESELDAPILSSPGLAVQSAQEVMSGIREYQVSAL